MHLAQNVTVVFLHASTNVTQFGSNIFLLQTPTGETIPFELGFLTVPLCLQQQGQRQNDNRNGPGWNSTDDTVPHGVTIHAVIYVGVVLAVYAFIILMMIASNVKRQRLEGEDAEYYEEFLQKRDHFKYAQLVAEARMSVEPHVRRATGFGPEQFQSTGGSPTPLRAVIPPSIVIQSA